MARTRCFSSRCLFVLLGLSAALLAKPVVRMAQAISDEVVVEDSSGRQAGLDGIIVSVSEVTGLATLDDASGFEVELAVGSENAQGDSPRRLLFCRSSCGVLGEGRFKVEDLRVGSRLLVQTKRLDLKGQEFLVAGDAVGLGENRELTGYVPSDSIRITRSNGRIYHSVRVIELGDGSNRSSPRVVNVQWCVEQCGEEATTRVSPHRMRQWSFVTLRGTRESRKVFTLTNLETSLTTSERFQNATQDGNNSLGREPIGDGRLRGRIENTPSALKVLKPILVLASRALE